MRLLVCGGRDYQDLNRVMRVLDNIHEKCGITEIIHGAAKGADSLAGQWARKNGIRETAVPANWYPNGKLDRSAGPKRNREMLAMKPDGVVAFPGGSGTADMARIAEEAGIKVMRLI
jgi:predicted Rossmann-fold nucleotide-binding protein